MTKRRAPNLCCTGCIKPPWPCVITMAAVFILLTCPHALTGIQAPSSLVAAPPSSWQECTGLALTSLRPRVRHRLADAVEEDASTAVTPLRGPVPGSASHIALTHSHVMSLTTAACPGTQQPTLVFTTIGGFGDRLKGMVTAYYAALLTHAKFRVSWTVPSPIAPYFDVDPALLWEKDNTGLSDNPDYEPFETHLVVPGASAVDVIDVYVFFTDPANDLLAGLAPPANGTVTVLRTNAPSWLEVVRHPSLRRAAELYGLADLSRRDLFVLAVQAVLRRFKPVVMEAALSALPKPLQAPVRKNLAYGFVGAGVASGDAGRKKYPGVNVARLARRRGGIRLPNYREDLGPAPSRRLHEDAPVPALIGVQIRTGGIGEAWNDSEHRHPMGSARCFADQAKEWCLKVYSGMCVVFLTADSRAAAHAFVSALNGTGIAVMQTRGPILHTDRGVPVTSRPRYALTRASADPWLKTYADWAALSQADVLLMSHSGYGLTAAWAGGVSHVQQLHKGGSCEWARLDDCAELPG